jgi:hypothetical protein
VIPTAGFPASAGALAVDPVRLQIAFIRKFPRSPRRTARLRGPLFFLLAPNFARGASY